MEETEAAPAPGGSQTAEAALQQEDAGRQQEGEDAQLVMSDINPTYPKMLNEFVHKDVLFVHWTRREFIETVERDFQFFDDDIVIATFPKSGTTLMQEMAWLIQHDVDVAGAKAARVFERVPFLEENYTSRFPGHPDGCFPIEYLPDMRRPRIIKTHLPYHIVGPRLQRQGVKTIFVVRNPKDTMVSYFHFYKGVVDYGPWPWGFRQFFRMWMDRWIVGGDWFKVTKDWWSQRDRPDLLVVKYEDLVRRPRQEIRRVAEFLGKELTDLQVQQVQEATSFETMRRNPATNYEDVPGMLPQFQFMRSGQVGDWKRFLLVAESEAFDSVYDEEMRDSGLRLEFE